MEITSATFFKPATAESLFGSTSADSIIGAGAADAASSSEQVALNMTIAAKREINRIRGYKIELNPAEKKKLLDIQTEIKKIEAKIGNGTVREDELLDRVELISEADRIIGKPIVDVEADETLAEYNNLKLAVLQRKLNGTIKKRVEFMERYKENIEQQIRFNPDRLSLQKALTSITAQLEQLNPLRSASQLSAKEAKAYDDIVKLINDHAGAKVELSAAEVRRVEALQSAIKNFQALLPNVAQPSAQQAANAYVALKR